MSTRNGNYSPHQIKLMQAELRAVYKKAEKRMGKDVMSWPTLVGWIKDAFEELTDKEREWLPEKYRHLKSVDFGLPNNFRKFCQGEHGKMKPAIKMVAIEIWLTEIDKQWSQLTWKQLNGFKDYSKVALSLDGYLNENPSCFPALHSNILAGEYFGKCLIEHPDPDHGLFLNIETSDNPRVFNIDVKESRLAEDSDLDDPDDEFATDYKVVLSGWVALSPEDNLVCFLKNVVTGENHIYHLIAFNKTVFDGAGVDCLLFLDRQIPSEIEKLDSPEYCISYLTNWAKENEGNLIRYERSLEHC